MCAHAHTHNIYVYIITLTRSSKRGKIVVLEVHITQSEKQRKIIIKVRITSARKYRIYDIDGAQRRLLGYSSCPFLCLDGSYLGIPL